MVRDQNARTLGKGTGQNALLQEVVGHMGVNSRERVVEQYDIAVAICSSGEIDPLLLTARQGDAAFSHVGAMTSAGLFTGIL